jgi:hypothetical protein
LLLLCNFTYCSGSYPGDRNPGPTAPGAYPSAPSAADIDDDEDESFIPTLMTQNRTVAPSRANDETGSSPSAPLLKRENVEEEPILAEATLVSEEEPLRVVQGYAPPTGSPVGYQNSHANQATDVAPRMMSR